METEDSAVSQRAPALLRQLPLRMHHRAIVVRDMEATRHFMEDILGMPLVAAWCESTTMMESDKSIDYVHAFFGLADGSAVAFFQFADPEYEARVLPQGQAEISRFDHLALKVTHQTREEIGARLTAAGIPYRITNHGYCKSIYLTTPDGLYIEFAEDPPDAEEIDAVQRPNAHAELARWMRGERSTTNNPYRQRDF